MHKSMVQDIWYKYSIERRVEMGGSLNLMLAFLFFIPLQRTLHTRFSTTRWCVLSLSLSAQCSPPEAGWVCLGWLHCLPLRPGLDEGGDVVACDDGGVGGATGKQTHSWNIAIPFQTSELSKERRMSAELLTDNLSTRTISYIFKTKFLVGTNL